MTTTIGDVIRKHRLEKGMSMEELAEKLNVSASAICRYETNDRNIRIVMLNEIAKALGTTAAELLTEAEYNAATEQDDPTAKKKLKIIMSLKQLNGKNQEKIIDHIEALDALQQKQST